MIVNINRVEKTIERYGLKEVNRKREIVWNRSALYNFMRSQGFSLEKIGSLVGKGHVTVMNGLKIYELNKRYSDFQSYVKEIEQDLSFCFEVEDEYNDICINEAICMVNLENLISEKL